MKGVGAGTIGRKGGLSAVLRVSRSTTSLKGRPLLKRPLSVPSDIPGARAGTGTGPWGWQGGENKKGRTRNRPAGLAATHRTNSVLHNLCFCVCVCVTRTCLCQAPQAEAKREGRRRRAGSRGTLAKQGQHGIAFLLPAPHTNARLSHRTRRGIQWERGECKETKGGGSDHPSMHDIPFCNPTGSSLYLSNI